MCVHKSFMLTQMLLYFLHVLVQISVYGSHCLALSSTGNVWVWGCGDCGALGTGNTSAVRLALSLNLNKQAVMQVLFNDIPIIPCQ